MHSRKNRQNVSKLLVFLKIAILGKAGIKILSVFNRYVTFHKRLETSVFDESFCKLRQIKPKENACEEK